MNFCEDNLLKARLCAKCACAFIRGTQFLEVFGLYLGGGSRK